MESNSTLSFIEKAKSFAIGAIGCGIFSLGTTYFSEQSIYRVPRILIPIFEIFGNIGLAIGMMILGAVLVYYAYSIFRKNKGNKLFFFVPILLFAIVFYFIISRDNNTRANKPTLQELIDKSNKEREKAIAEVEKTEKPNFSQPKVQEYFAQFESLYQKQKQDLQDKNTIEIAKNQKAIQDWNLLLVKHRNLLQNDQQKYQFDRYVAKLINEYYLLK